MDSHSQTNHRIVADAYASFLRGNLEGFLAHFDDSSQLIEAQGLPYGGVYSGVASIRAALISIRGFWTDIEFEILDILSNDVHVIAYARFAGAGMKSGKRVELPIVEVWKMESSRVRSLTALYFDTAVAAAAIA
jgi:ketosteroid isomerase-like protein